MNYFKHKSINEFYQDIQRPQVHKYQHIPDFSFVTDFFEARDFSCFGSSFFFFRENTLGLLSSVSTALERLDDDDLLGVPFGTDLAFLGVTTILLAAFPEDSLLGVFFLVSFLAFPELAFGVSSSVSSPGISFLSSLSDSSDFSLPNSSAAPSSSSPSSLSLSSWDSSSDSGVIFFPSFLEESLLFLRVCYHNHNHQRNNVKELAVGFKTMNILLICLNNQIGGPVNILFVLPI